MIDRGIYEVCTEALHFLREEHEPTDRISPGDIDGYFDEILSILSETEDDFK